jgi:hypothetical protein
VQDADAGEALADPGHPHRDGVHLRHLELRRIVEGTPRRPRPRLIDYCAAASCNA